VTYGTTGGPHLIVDSSYPAVGVPSVPHCRFCGIDEVNIALVEGLDAGCPKRTGQISWGASSEPYYAGCERVITERFTLPEPPHNGAKRISFTIFHADHTPGEVWSLEPDGRVVGWIGWTTTQQGLRTPPTREEFERAWEAAVPVDRDLRKKGALA
jgi:hypothetical protein